METLNVSPLHNFDCMAGTGDIPRDQFNRAVLRPPPRYFSIEFLPSSYKGSCNHGMRITPGPEIDSVSTHAQNWEYEIWRKWEDILWFQETLESEYRRAAREKKVRLAQGKGVKSLNGMYKQDMASSWESLPPGPLPSSVAQDIHVHLPRLSKKGTVFRASQSTVDQRQKQFRSLVETLFSDDMPSLIQELRKTHHATDFFGLWRRDYDKLEKAPQFHPLTSSVFSSYFSESNSSLGGSKYSPSTSSRSSSARPRSKASSKNSTTSSTIRSFGRVSTDSSSIKSKATVVKRLSGSSEEGVPVPEMNRPRTLSNTSSDSSSTHSDVCSENGSTIEATPTIVVDDSPITFDHNPHVPVERWSSILEVLPKEREMFAKSSETCMELPRSASRADRKTNRSWQVLSVPNTKTISNEGKHNVRASYQSYTSIDSMAEAFLDGIGLSLPSIKEQDYRASIYTVMTTDSADGVLNQGSTSEDGGSPKRNTDTISLSDFEIYPETGEEDSIQDLVPFPSPTDLPQTPTPRPRLTLNVPTTPTRVRGHESSFESPPSPTSTCAPTSSIALSPNSSNLLYIKAVHNSSIIMLRVPNDTSFDDIRQRLYNKFVGQEGIPLSNEFAVAMAIPTDTAPSPAKSSSSKLSRSSSLSTVDKMELHFIDSQHDWEEVVLIKESSKVTLRILDVPRV